MTGGFLDTEADHIHFCAIALVKSTEAFGPAFEPETCVDPKVMENRFCHFLCYILVHWLTDTASKILATAFSLLA